MDRSSTRHLALAAVVLCFLAAPSAGQSGEQVAQLREARNRLEETLRRLVPLPATPVEVRAALEKVARASGLNLAFGPFSGPERLRLADGRGTPIELLRVEVSGQGELGKLLHFLSTVGNAGRVVHLEALRVTAREAGTVGFSARLGLPQYSDVPQEGARPATRDAAAGLLAELEPQRLLQDTVFAMIEMLDASRPDAVAWSLARFTKGAEPRAIALREARFEGELVLEGVTVGAAARAALSQELAAASLEQIAIEAPASGTCRAFTARARLPLGAASALVGDGPVVLAGNGLFDPAAESWCGRTPDTPAVPVTVRGNDPNGITVRLEDVGLAGAFGVLSHLTGESFVIDHDVRGNVSLKAEGAALDEILSAMRAAGVVVGPPPLRRVVRTEPAPRAATGKYTGERLDLLLESTDLANLLCSLSHGFSLEFALPRGLKRQVAIFAKDVPLDLALEGLLAAQGLRRETRGNRIALGLGSGPIDARNLVDACQAAADSSSGRSSQARLEDADAGDVRLRALGKTKAGWRAWMEVPPGLLREAFPGQALFDGRVAAIDAAGVKFTTGTGESRQVEFRAGR